jgi:hypothetical protein
VASKTIIAGNRDLAGNASVSTRSAVPIQGLSPINRIPSSMKLNPSPMTTPSSAGRGTHRAKRAANPVVPRTSQINPVTTPAPTTAADVSAATFPDWGIAAAQ